MREGENRFSHEQCTCSSLILLLHLLTADRPPPSRRSFVRGHALARGGNGNQILARLDGSLTPRLTVLSLSRRRRSLSLPPAAAASRAPFTGAIRRSCSTSAQLLARTALPHPYASPEPARATYFHGYQPRASFSPRRLAMTAVASLLQRSSRHDICCFKLLVLP